jgi:hypothetical protein
MNVDAGPEDREQTGRLSPHPFKCHAEGLGRVDRCSSLVAEIKGYSSLQTNDLTFSVGLSNARVRRQPRLHRRENDHV